MKQIKVENKNTLHGNNGDWRLHFTVNCENYQTRIELHTSSIEGCLDALRRAEAEIMNTKWEIQNGIA